MTDTDTDDLPEPPEGIVDDGEDLYRAVVAKYELSAAELALLAEAIAAPAVGDDETFSGERARVLAKGDR
jgi:hypothetical protein